MEPENQKTECCWISLLLRLAVASLFGAAVIDKFLGGLEGTVVYFQTLFAETWLPEPVVVMQARIAPWIELLITVWLIVGFKLRIGWIVASFFMLSLSFGTMVAGQYSTAADNYLFLLLCLAGLYFSQFDRLNLDRLSSHST